MDCTDPSYFSINDQVQWNKNRYPKLVNSMISRYGEGPFRVVGLRLHLEGVKCISPAAVTIEFTDSTRHEFAGEWFKKV